MILTFTSNARNDLHQIVILIARDNADRAISFVNELEQRCMALIKAPLAYAILLRHLDKAIRRIVHGNYLIFYCADDEEVTILRVLHSSMDVEGQLGGA